MSAVKLGEENLKKLAVLAVLAAALAAPGAASSEDQFGWYVDSQPEEQVVEALTATDVAVGDTVTVDAGVYVTLEQQFGW
jgi:hypothetical protein